MVADDLEEGDRIAGRHGASGHRWRPFRCGQRCSDVGFVDLDTNRQPAQHLLRTDPVPGPAVGNAGRIVQPQLPQGILKLLTVHRNAAFPLIPDVCAI
jgi:hypothetical protein